MAFEYFSKLPVIDYPISKTQTKRGRDILHRFFVDQKYAKMNEYLMQYRAEDGDALDVISAKLYRRADYHSIIMFINPAKGVFGGGLPVSSAVQEEYMDTLYGDTVHVLNHILPPVVIYDWVSSGPTVPPEIKAKIDLAEAEEYNIFYQGAVNDPGYSSGIINVPLVIDYLKGVELARGKPITGWAVLNWEIPWMVAIEEGPTNPIYNTCVENILSLLRAVKREFPRARWTIYGPPGLARFPNDSDWIDTPLADQQAEIERQITNYSPILFEFDWYSPGVYDKSGNVYTTANERAWRMARVGVAKEFLRRNNLPRRPVIPFLSPFFQGDSNPLVFRRISMNRLLQNQILPVLDAGSDGIAIWTAGDYYPGLALGETIIPANSTQEKLRAAYTIDYFAGITPGTNGTPGWTAASTRATLLAGLGNVVADMAVAAAGSTALQQNDTVQPAIGYGLEEGETVLSWISNDLNREADIEIAGVVKEWNPRMMTVKLDQTLGSFSPGMVLGNESKTSLFKITKKIQEKDAVHHFEATQDTFAGTPLKKGSIIDPLSAVYPVDGGIVLTPVGVAGACGQTGGYRNTLVYLYNGVGIPPAVSPYIKAVSNQEQEYRNIESNRTMNVPSNNPNLLEGLVRAVEDILDGVQ